MFRFLQTIYSLNPSTGVRTSVWPFILLGVAVLLVAALVVLTIVTKKK